MLNLEALLVDIPNRNPHFVLINVDFNAESRNWSTYDTATSQGAYLDSFMNLYGLNKLLTEPTRILEHSSSCIDLIFSSQSNFIRDTGIHTTLHPKCHHQLIYSKLNLEIEYPPPCARKIF